jgi:hypothetical protein
MKSIAAAALIVIATATTAPAPAEAGFFKDKAVQAAQAARGVASIARIKGSCLANKLRGRDGGFLCQ